MNFTGTCIHCPIAIDNYFLEFGLFILVVWVFVFYQRSREAISHPTCNLVSPLRFHLSAHLLSCSRAQLIPLYTLSFTETPIISQNVLLHLLIITTVPRCHL